MLCNEIYLLREAFSNHFSENEPETRFFSPRILFIIFIILITICNYFAIPLFLCILSSPSINPELVQDPRCQVPARPGTYKAPNKVLGPIKGCSHPREEHLCAFVQEGRTPVLGFRSYMSICPSQVHFLKAKPTQNTQQKVFL